MGFTERSKTFYATEAILEHLSDLEDLYLAEHELEEIRAGRSETVPLEEIMRFMGIRNLLCMTPQPDQSSFRSCLCIYLKSGSSISSDDPDFGK